MPCDRNEANCSAAIVERDRGGRVGRVGELPTGRMSNKQKLLKIIVAYLAACRNGEVGGPEIERRGAPLPLLPTVRRIKGATH